MIYGSFGLKKKKMLVFCIENIFIAKKTIQPLIIVLKMRGSTAVNYGTLK